MGTNLGISSAALSRKTSATYRSTSAVRTASHSSVAATMMMVGDVLAVLAAAYIALHISITHLPVNWSQAEPFSIGAASLAAQAGYLAWFTFCLVVLNHHDGLYGRLQTQSILHEQRMTVQACLIAGLLLCGGMYMTHNATISRVVVISLVTLTTLFLCCLRGFWRYAAHRDYEKGIGTKNVLILGASHVGDALRTQIVKHRRLGRNFKGFVEVPGNVSAALRSLDPIGDLCQLRHLVRQHFIDEIIIAESCSTTNVVELVELAKDMDVEVLSIPGLYEDMSPAAPLFYLGDFPVVSIHRRNDRAISCMLKRMIDFVFTSMLLLMLTPVFVAVALLVKFTSPGPVFYVSDRIGRKGRVFRLWKFRTMCADAERMKAALMKTNERDGILFKMKNDPRITPVGRFLRKYSLDELPQLFNVILGDMSLVGPRPPLASEVAKYELEHYRRLEVLPGLTGLWQIRARGNPSFEQYVALDIAYVENWNVWMDLKILLRTAEVVVRGTGS